MNDTTRWTRSTDSQEGTSNVYPVDNRKRGRRGSTRPHETEEEAIIRRFHDAQRMARFRAKKKKAVEEAKAMDASKLSEIALISELKRRNVAFQITRSPVSTPYENKPKTQEPIKQKTSLATISLVNGKSKYSQLLSVIEELGRDIKLSYAGSRSSAEKLKMGIVQARTLVRDCLMETEVNSRQ